MRVSATIGIAASLIAASGHSGPISKWDSREPDASFTSAVGMADLERCLIDMNGIGGIPHVYSQADRPQQRLIVWQNDDMDTTARIDLSEEGSRTKIVIWKALKKNRPDVLRCIPDLRE